MLSVLLTGYLSSFLPREEEVVQSLLIKPQVWANIFVSKNESQRDHIRMRPLVGPTGWAAKCVNVSCNSPKGQWLKYRIRRHKCTGMSGGNIQMSTVKSQEEAARCEPTQHSPACVEAERSFLQWLVRTTPKDWGHFWVCLLGVYTKKETFRERTDNVILTTPVTLEIKYIFTTSAWGVNMRNCRRYWTCSFWLKVQIYDETTPTPAPEANLKFRLSPDQLATVQKFPRPLLRSE